MPEQPHSQQKPTTTNTHTQNIHDRQSPKKYPKHTTPKHLPHSTKKKYPNALKNKRTIPMLTRSHETQQFAIRTHYNPLPDRHFPNNYSLKTRASADQKNYATSRRTIQNPKAQNRPRCTRELPTRMHIQSRPSRTTHAKDQGCRAP